MPIGLDGLEEIKDINELKFDTRRLVRNKTNEVKTEHK